MLGKDDGIRQRARARAWHQLFGIDAGIGQLLENFHALIEPERIAFAGGPEGRKRRAPVLQQPLAVLHEAIDIGAAVLAPRRHHRCNDPGKIRIGFHSASLS